MDPEESIEEEEIVEESSLRDDLESAIEEEGGEEDGEQEQSETKNEKTEEETGTKEVRTPDEGTETVGDGEKETTGINAPIGFSIEAREKWKDVPDIVKSQIQKRENEISSAMANTGEFRRTHTAISDLAKSYAPILAAEGAENPMQAIEGLFRTVAELRVGSPQQVASKMASLIGHYGVDIGMLDAALSGAPPANPEMNAMETMLDKRLAPITQYMQQQTDGRNQQMVDNRNTVQSELDTFARSAEFLNDVRMDMADLIDLSSKRGVNMSFEDAYKKACAMHPEISKVLTERASAESLQNSGKRSAGKRNASSGIRSSSAELGGKGGEKSLRGEIESLWDDYE